MVVTSVADIDKSDDLVDSLDFSVNVVVDVNNEVTVVGAFCLVEVIEAVVVDNQPAL